MHAYCSMTNCMLTYCSNLLSCLPRGCSHQHPSLMKRHGGVLRQLHNNVGIKLMSKMGYGVACETVYLCSRLLSGYYPANAPLILVDQLPSDITLWVSLCPCCAPSCNFLGSFTLYAATAVLAWRSQIAWLLLDVIRAAHNWDHDLRSLADRWGLQYTSQPLLAFVHQDCATFSSGSSHQLSLGTLSEKYSASPA